MPDGAPTNAIVRCPMCSHEYSLSEVLDQRPPTLQIVSDSPVTEGAPLDAEEFVSADRASNPFEGFGAQDVAERDLAKFDLSHDGNPTISTHDPEEAGMSKDSSTFNDPAISYSSPRRSTRRSARREKNPVVETMKIVIGGLLALPVAQLIFWWGIKQDPVNLGPTVSKVAPFVVPEEFRGDLLGDAKDSDSKDLDSQANTKLPDSNLKQ